MAEKKSVRKRNIKNTISIILGLISLAAAYLIPYIVAVTGVLGIIFAYTEKGKAPRKQNTWAFVLNLIGLFLAIIFLTISLVVLILNKYSFYPAS